MHVLINDICFSLSDLLHYVKHSLAPGGPPLRKLPRSILEKTKNRTAMWPVNLTTGHIPRENHNLKGYMHPNVHDSTASLLNALSILLGAVLPT